MSSSDPTSVGTQVVIQPPCQRGFVKVPEMRKMLDEAYEDQVGDVVVDLAGVRVLDAVAIAVIAVASDRIRQTGRQVVIQGTSRRQERNIRLRGLVVPVIPAPRTPVSERSRRAGRRASAA
jgi:anti-anti-sigma factor